MSSLFVDVEEPIRSKFLSLKTLFAKNSDEHIFRITRNMRDYEWGEDEVEQLFTDLVDAHDDPNRKTYELNTMVVTEANVHAEETKAWEVADGQQRLVTLSLLYAALRDVSRTSNFTTADEEDAPLDEDIQAALTPKIRGKPKMPRIHLRGKANNALQAILQGNLPKITDDADNASKRILSNFNILLRNVKETNTDHAQFCEEFFDFLSNAVFISLLIPKDSPMAYKMVFSQRRGKNADPIDFFKQMVIQMGIDDEAQQDQYLAKWAKLEMEVGRSTLEKTCLLLGQMELNRMHSKDGELEFLEAYWKAVRNGAYKSTADFFDSKISVAALVLRDLQQHAFPDRLFDVRPELDFLLRCLSVKATMRDMEAIILHLTLPHRNHDYLSQAIPILERVGLLIVTTSHLNQNQRKERLRNLRECVLAEKSVEHLDLSLEERELLLQELYERDWKPGQSTKVATAILLRLEATLAKESEATIQTQNISLEHIVPQTIGDSSEWKKEWTEEEAARCGSKLGNFGVLNIKTNSMASNHNFEVKRKKYSKMIFSRMQRISQFQRWTPKEFEALHNETLVQIQEAFKI